MNAVTERAPDPVAPRTTVERASERDLVVTRTFDAPPRAVFEAWTQPELLKQWWAPKSNGVALLSCEADVRVGGRYRFEFGRDTTTDMAFFGRYVTVTPHARLAWTNDESQEGPVTTVSFEEKAGRTQVVLHERYPTTDALDEAFSGMSGCVPEQFAQLDALLVTRGANAVQA